MRGETIVATAITPETVPMATRGGIGSSSAGSSTR